MFPLYHGLLGAGFKQLIQQALLCDNRQLNLLRCRLPFDGFRRKWAFSAWVRKDEIASGGTRVLMGGHPPTGTPANNYNEIAYDGDDRFFYRNNDASLFRREPQFRDHTSWMHKYMLFDTDNATQDRRIIHFRNGVEMTEPNSTNYPSLGTASSGIMFRGYGSAGMLQSIGATRRGGGANLIYGGALARIEFWEGANTPLTPDAVGEFDVNGVWSPKAYEGPVSDYGSRGFLLDFADENHFGRNANEGDGWDASFEAAQWDGNLAGYVFADGKIAKDANNTNSLRRLAQAFSGDFEVRWSKEAGSQDGAMTVGVYDVTEDATFNPANLVGDMSLMTNSWWVRATLDEVWYGGTQVNSFTSSDPNADIYSLRRTGDTFSFYQDDVLEHTWTQTFGGDVRIVVGLGGSSPFPELNQFEWKDGGLMVGSSFFDPDGTYQPSDQLNDTPEAVYCTGQIALPNFDAGGNFTRANARVIELTPNAAMAGDQLIYPDMDVYFEAEITSSNSTDQVLIGVMDISRVAFTPDWDSPSGANLTPYWAYIGINGDAYEGSLTPTPFYGLPWTTGANIGVRVYPNGNIEFFLDGSSQGVLSGNPITMPTTPFMQNATGGAGNCTITWNFGEKPFAYSIPSGARPLNSQHPDIPTPIKDGGEHYVTHLRTGTGVDNTDVDIGIAPGLTWIKDRDAAVSHRLVDTVRGATLRLASDLNSAEAVDASGVKQFLQTGYRLGVGGGYNTNNNRYVDWNWQPGVTPGFAIVEYTGDGVAGRGIPHGLGVAPEYISVKALDVTGAGNASWQVFHIGVDASAPETFILQWDTNATRTVATSYNNQLPDATNFYVDGGSAMNESGIRYIAYVWAPVDGFSAFGAYNGNGSSDGPLIMLGFKPAYFHTKIAVGSVNSWNIRDTARDPFNVAKRRLFIEGLSAEDETGLIDILANGLKIRNTANSVNQNGSRFIYAAFAENPHSLTRAV